MHELSGVLAIAHRDLVKLLRDRTRLIADLVFPMVFIGVLGVSLQSAFDQFAEFNFLTFVFTGVLAQTLWQSSAMGVISLIEDRENDFSQEIFVSPISRYSIVVGKVLGESLVALPQGLAIVDDPRSVADRPDCHRVRWRLRGAGALTPPQPAGGHPDLSVHHASAVLPRGSLQPAQ
jgi:hypothetical protein